MMMLMMTMMMMLLVKIKMNMKMVLKMIAIMIEVTGEQNFLQAPCHYDRCCHYRAILLCFAAMCHSRLGANRGEHR